MVQTVEAKQVRRAASTVLFPELEFGVKPCGKYTREDLSEILSRIAFDQELANTGGKTLQLDRDEHVDITATARNSLAKPFNESFAIARSRPLFGNSKRVTLP